MALLPLAGCDKGALHRKAPARWKRSAQPVTLEPGKTSFRAPDGPSSDSCHNGTLQGNSPPFSKGLINETSKTGEKTQFCDFLYSMDFHGV